MSRTLWCDDAAFGKMPAQSVDQLRPLAHLHRPDQIRQLNVLKHPFGRDGLCCEHAGRLPQRGRAVGEGGLNRSGQ